MHKHFILQKLAEIASPDKILSVAQTYYDNNDPNDIKHRWSHVLDTMEVAKKIRGRELTPQELGMLAFHDTGYKNFGSKDHALRGASNWSKEAPGLGYSPEDIKHIAKCIRFHMRHPKKRSPLLNDDLQLLMYASDEGTPTTPREDMKKYVRKAFMGRYSGLTPDRDVARQLDDIIKYRFHDYSKAPGLVYYRKIYPNWHSDLYKYWQSPNLKKEIKELVQEYKNEKK